MPAIGQSPTTTLERGKPVERRLNAGESHNYEVQLGKNRFFYAELIQKGVDILITASDPQGEKIADFDSPQRHRRPGAHPPAGAGSRPLPPGSQTTERTGRFGELYPGHTKTGRHAIKGTPT